MHMALFHVSHFVPNPQGWPQDFSLVIDLKNILNVSRS